MPTGHILEVIDEHQVKRRPARGSDRRQRLSREFLRDMSGVSSSLPQDTAR